MTCTFIDVKLHPESTAGNVSPSVSAQLVLTLVRKSVVVQCGRMAERLARCRVTDAMQLYLQLTTQSRLPSCA